MRTTVIEIPEHIGLGMDHFVRLYKTTEEQYAMDAIRNYNVLQREVKAFRKAYPDSKFRVRLHICPVSPDDSVRNVATLVY